MLFKKGDKVKIVRKIERYEDEECLWSTGGSMDKLIGTVGIISGVSNNGNSVNIGNWIYLKECLELVNKQYSIWD